MRRTMAASASLIDQLAGHHIIAQRRHTAHPNSLALPGSDLVTDTLASDLALELGEGQQHVQHQPPHLRQGRIIHWKSIFVKAVVEIDGFIFHQAIKERGSGSDGISDNTFELD